MSKFKTVSESNPARRVFSDGLLKVNSVDKDKNYKVSLMLLSEGRNRNGWVYENIAANLSQFVNIPLLYSVIDGKVANSHDFEMKKDKNGETYASFIGAESEHIAGWIVDKLPNGEPNAYLATIDGRQWVCVKEAFLPAFYNKEFIDELESNGGQMSISIETLVYKNRVEGDTEYEENWKCVGVTILGRGVAPAVAGANIRKLSARGEAFREIKMRAASYYEQETPIEPQTQKQNSKKGEARTMAKVRKLADMSSLFPAYTVLGVNGQTVALLDEKGRTCTYTFRENEDTVVTEQIVEVAANSLFGEGDNAVSVPVEQLVGTVQARLDATKAALDKATKENTDLTAKINAMTEAEKKRREKLVRDAVNSELAENRECFKGEADIDEHLCDELLTDERVCKYAEMVDCDGNFCGDERARADVNDKCNKAVREAKKERQAKNNSHFDWGTIVEGNPEAGKTSIDKILED